MRITHTTVHQLLCTGQSRDGGGDKLHVVLMLISALKSDQIVLVVLSPTF